MTRLAEINILLIVRSSKEVMDAFGNTGVQRRNKAGVERHKSASERASSSQATLHDKQVSYERKIFLACLIFRLFNALAIFTSYVPDEFWQGPEVAHNMVFGYGYLTWEWTHGLRGWTFPMLFAAPYKILHLLRLDSTEAVILAPRLVQGVFAAFGDLYLYKLAGKLFGQEVSSWALACNVLSWFTFYCVTRTITNSTETVLTTAALYYWPWKSLRSPDAQFREKTSVVISLSLAAFTCVIRPTAAIIWFPLCSLNLMFESSKALFVFKKLLPPGVIALLWSVLIDSFFYGKLTLVHINFAKFNVIKNMGTFYGSHPWYWYFTQGFPVVVFTHLVPFVLGVLRAPPTQRIPAWLILWILIVYSFLGHKEFRFIFPVVPLAMCYCGLFLSRVNQPPDKKVQKGLSRTPGPKKAVMKAAVCVFLLASTNVPVALYFCVFHQRGTIDVMGFLREESRGAHKQPSVLFLMPCHSTPFYSYLHQHLSMRFLQCPPSDKPGYIDEAEQFFANPMQWLTDEFQQSYSHSSSTYLPTHLVLFNRLLPEITHFLDKYHYKECARFFHTHVPEGRVGSEVVAYCMKKE